MTLEEAHSTIFTIAYVLHILKKMRAISEEGTGDRTRRNSLKMYQEMFQ